MHLIIISVINLALVVKMISKVWTGNDKAIIFVVFAYLILILINAFIWLLLNIYKKVEYKIHKKTTLFLAVLFVPVLIVSSLY